MIMPYVWLGILIFAVIFEVAAPGLVSIWFVPSALISMLLALFDVPLPLQLTAFFGLSIILIVFSRTIWKKYISAKPVEPTNADINIGMTGIVTECIDNINAVGEVKVNGLRWSARSENGEVIEKGSHVKVLAIDGVKLICKKID